MAVFSRSTGRRSTKLQDRATQQLIVFRLLHENFALPIKAVQKVIPIGNVYGAPQGAGASLTLYQERELIVIDAEHRIFRSRKNPDSSPSASRSWSQNSPYDTTQSRYLLVVQNSSQKLAGLPIDEPPYLLRVPSSAFAPLTSDYISEGNIRCVSALIVQNNEQPPLFLLNPDQLFQSQQALPPAVGT
jgi:chemotaxis signal transduction protein